MPTQSEIMSGWAASLRATAADIDTLVSGSTVQTQTTPTTVTPPAGPIWALTALPKLTIPAEVAVPPGTQEIFIPVSVDRTDRQSFMAYIDRLANVTGGLINVGSTADARANFDGMDAVYQWSPFDDGLHWVRIAPRTKYPAGRAFQVSIRVKGLGDSQKGRGVIVRFVEGAAAQTITKPFHRPLRRLDLSAAKRKNTFDPATVKWSPTGKDAQGNRVLMSALSHGRAQDGNGETGLYADETIAGAEKPISYDAAERAIRLHTCGFATDKRLELDQRIWSFQAVVLQGLHVDALCGTEGVWRMEAKIPVRKYSWPAFWLINRSLKSTGEAYSQWPGEIDILEKFNGIYGTDTVSTSSFAQHYGNLGSNTRAGTFGNDFEVQQYGLNKASMDEVYHSWACHVRYDANDTTKSEVTFFVDDVEVGCHVLHSRHQDLTKKVEFYPIFNVAVKTPATYTAEQYNTDEGRNRTGDMLVRDIAYYPTGAKLV